MKCSEALEANTGFEKSTFSTLFRWWPTTETHKCWVICICNKHSLKFLHRELGAIPFCMREARLCVVRALFELLIHTWGSVTCAWHGAGVCSQIKSRQRFQPVRDAGAKYFTECFKDAATKVKVADVCPPCLPRLVIHFNVASEIRFHGSQIPKKLAKYIAAVLRPRTGWIAKRSDVL